MAESSSFGALRNPYAYHSANRASLSATRNQCAFTPLFSCDPPSPVPGKQKRFSNQPRKRSGRTERPVPYTFHLFIYPIKTPKPFHRRCASSRRARRVILSGEHFQGVYVTFLHSVFYVRHGTRTPPFLSACGTQLLNKAQLRTDPCTRLSQRPRSDAPGPSPFFFEAFLPAVRSLHTRGLPAATRLVSHVSHVPRRAPQFSQRRVIFARQRENQKKICRDTA